MDAITLQTSIRCASVFNNFNLPSKWSTSWGTEWAKTVNGFQMVWKCNNKM